MNDKILFFDSKNGLIDFLNRFIDSGEFTSVNILTDNNTSKLCLPHISSIFKKKQTREIKTGLDENYKNLQSVQTIWNALFERQVDRKGLIINLGGGVVTDTGGFVASTYKRGISYVNIPTTLLGMVDAAIGGKTGINFYGAKNQIGTIYPPEKVLIYPGFLKTLPETEFYSGLAEMLKHGLIRDKNYFYRTLEWKRNNLLDLIKRSVEIKCEIVNEDRNETGMRKLLNFGHTFGHAFESFFRKSNLPITHGHAVALGMIGEAYISTKMSGLAWDDFKTIRNHLSSLYDLSPLKYLDIYEIIRLMLLDKKNIAGEVGFVLLKSIGESEFNKKAPVTLITETLDYLQTKI